MNQAINSAAVIGHDEAIRQITAAFASQRMHHAWLLTGIEGIGKAMLGLRIADHVLSGGANPIGKLDKANRSTKLLLAVAHPDLLVIGRSVDEKTGAERNLIATDDALKIAIFLHKTATHGGWRVVLVDEAHRLNRNGQNAILKILEEPPARVLIVMTATTPGALLPTIRSRCRLLPLEPLSETALRQILTEQAPQSAGDFAQVMTLAGGSAGFALKLIHNEVLPLYAELLGLLQAMPKLDTVRAHKLADQISRKADAESFELLTALLIDHLRRDIARIARQPDHQTLSRQLQLWERVKGVFQKAEHANLDRKLAVINALSDIRAAMA